MNETLKLIIELLIQLITIIPLVIALIKFVSKSIKEKNWTKMVQLAIRLMIEAENKFSNPVEKEEYVVDLVLAAAKEINYEISEIELKDFIKNAIILSKQINIKSKVDKTAK